MLIVVPAVVLVAFCAGMVWLRRPSAIERSVNAERRRLRALRPRRTRPGLDRGSRT